MSCFEYIEYNNSISIEEYYCYEGNDKGYPVITDVIIPEEIDAKEVTRIGYYAFYEKQLTSVTIKGKTSTDDFTSYGYSVFGWASDSECNDTNCITWEPQV